MCHDDINTKIVVPQYYHVWFPFLKASCFLNTSSSPSRRTFPSAPLSARLLGGVKTPVPGTFPLSGPPSPVLSGASAKRHASSHSLPVGAEQLSQRIPFIYPKAIEGERCMQTHCSNPFLHAPLSPLPIWWPLPLLCLQVIQMASCEGGTVRGSKT